MGDVICKECGQPWEYYYLNHELDGGRDVLHGEGCPLCDWGEFGTGEYEQEWMASLESATDEDVMKFL